MAYTSKGYQKNWTYEPTGDNFEAHVGRILAGDLDLKSSMRTQALEQLEAKRALNAADQLRDVPGLNARVEDSRKPGKVEAAGYMWVDPQGRPLAPPGEGARKSGSGTTNAAAASTASAARRPRLTERQAACGAMEPVQRSMHLWSRINPGCVPESYRMPRSTFRDHFGPKADAEDAEKLDKTNHFKKTDFSEYTEVKLKLMNHLK
ncbi:hypothetical protein Agub_g12174 [Astrephomene gubernaculifera]|uniref:Uncharacterized protein n=1 Tax=Astrephomene gubernaculifera TaxID=47775 RepID=A0AAD3DXT8_9CHLO|nr:hypothetical protein Agub_g12174 [Astrephomene gubernaculifera]